GGMRSMVSNAAVRTRSSGSAESTINSASCSCAFGARAPRAACSRTSTSASPCRNRSTRDDRRPGSGAATLLDEVLEIRARDTQRLDLAAATDGLGGPPVDAEGHRAGIADLQHGPLANLVCLALTGRHQA